MNDLLQNAVKAMKVFIDAVANGQVKVISQREYKQAVTVAESFLKTLPLVYKK